MRFRVLTWNIHKGIGGLDRRYRIDRVISLLGHYEPDIALLQEVSEDMPRSQFHDQAELLSAELGMPHIAYGPEHRFSIGGYGNAILSRWPLFDVHHFDLTIGTRKKRGGLQARSRVRFGKRSRTVVIHNLHLGLAGSERGRQLERFLSTDPFRGLHERTPIVFGGDLNDLWGTLGPRFLHPAGFARAGRLVNTFPAWLPIRPLDGLFIRGDLSWRHCMACGSKLAKQASDHLPLIAELDLKMSVVAAPHASANGAPVRTRHSRPPAPAPHARR
jgi:endonuclease/exonuclease/phosphatase family metal-dependent hydrolase